MDTGSRIATGATAALTIVHPVVILLVANLLDGVFTLSFLHLGVAQEANPLMRAAYDSSPLWFMLSKVALVELGAVLLWLHRETLVAQLALQGSALVYTGIVGYHLGLLKALSSLGP